MALLDKTYRDLPRFAQTRQEITVAPYATLLGVHALVSFFGIKLNVPGPESITSAFSGTR